MLEQPEVGEGRGVAIGSLKLALSEETRASLAAVRAAQESALRRARQETMQARIWSAVLVGALALGAVALKPRLGRWRQARAKTAQPAPAPAAIATLAMATVAAPVVRAPEPPLRAAAAPLAPLVASAPAPAPPVAVPAEATPAAPAAATGSGVPAEGCDTSTQRGLWRRSAEACIRAFAADPKNASIALAVAQAEHAHARLDEAAVWARRALALDPNAAEAYVIVARADAEHGRDDEARAAYQHYLELAPRGWHKNEARAALRRPSGRSR
jgi:hypothetical protein